MKVAGIIVEYNPLHNGHLHHINETKRLSNCDVLVCVMSGNFMQRGEPAMIDKFTRTKMALASGIDLVVELPFVFSVQSADMFAYTSVSILNHLQVDEIYFGSESGDVNQLETVADILDSEEYNVLLKKNLDKGLSYPTASDNAMTSLYPQNDYQMPNNILGIQYIKAARKLESSIKLKTIKRVGTGYYEEEQSGTTIQSATAIRKGIKQGADISSYVPNAVFDLLRNRKIVDINDFTKQMNYILSSASSNEMNDIFGFEEGFENRLLKVHTMNSIDDLINKSITRRYTNSKIRRMLMHLLCNTKKETLTSFEIPYIRILGMNDQGKSLLNKVKKELEIPLITKIKEQKHPYLEQELRASKVYSLVSDIDVYKEEFKPVIY